MWDCKEIKVIHCACIASKIDDSLQIYTRVQIYKDLKVMRRFIEVYVFCALRADLKKFMHFRRAFVEHARIVGFIIFFFYSISLVELKNHS